MVFDGRRGTSKQGSWGSWDPCTPAVSACLTPVVLCQPSVKCRPAASLWFFNIQQPSTLTTCVTVVNVDLHDAGLFAIWLAVRVEVEFPLSTPAAECLGDCCLQMSPFLNWTPSKKRNPVPELDQSRENASSHRLVPQLEAPKNASSYRLVPQLEAPSSADASFPRPSSSP